MFSPDVMKPVIQQILMDGADRDIDHHVQCQLVEVDSRKDVELCGTKVHYTFRLMAYHVEISVVLQIGFSFIYR
jgi:hypothetical protein